MKILLSLFMLVGLSVNAVAASVSSVKPTGAAKTFDIGWGFPCTFRTESEAKGSVLNFV